jgi:hypothetical protein
MHYGRVFAAALLLTACAAPRFSTNSAEGTYTTTPFRVTPQTILRVEDTHVGDEGLVLYVEVGVCGKPLEQLLPVYVHGAPRGVFHVGQTIAQGSIRVKRGFKLGIRIVSPDELKQLGCTLAND